MIKIYKLIDKTTKENVDFNKIRYWKNKVDSKQLYPSYPEKNIEQFLSDNNIDWQEITNNSKYIINFNELGKDSTLTIKFHNTNDIIDYVIVSDWINDFNNDNTYYFYLDSNINIFNLKNGSCSVTYTLDEWSTYGQIFHNILKVANPKVWRMRQHKNRFLCTANYKSIYEKDPNEKINTYIEEISKESPHTVLVKSYTYEYSKITQPYQKNDLVEDCYKVLEYEKEIVDNTEIYLNLTFDVSLEPDTYFMDSKDDYEYYRHSDKKAGDQISYSLNFTYKKDQTEYLFKIDSEKLINYTTAIQLRRGYTWNDKNFIDISYTYLNLLGAIKFIFVPETKKIIVFLAFVNTLKVTDFKNVGFDKYTNIITVVHIGAYINLNWVNKITKDYKPEIPTTIDSPDKPVFEFYPDFVAQPYLNKVEINEQIQLLPIQIKNYSTKIVTAYETIFPDSITKEINVNFTDKYDNSTEVKAWSPTDLIGWNFNDITNDKILSKGYYSDFILTNDNLYTYIVCQPTGEAWYWKYSNYKINLKYKNVWFLIPVAIQDLTPRDTDLNYFAINNTMEKIKAITELGSEASIISVFKSPLPPLVLMLWSAPNLAKIFGYFNESYVVNNYQINWYRYKGIDLLIVDENSFPIWLENNAFINKTFEWVKQINVNPYKLPTIIENEPFYYSPQCFNTNLIPIDNKFNAIGLDLLDLKYQVYFIGLKMSTINNQTLVYFFNHLNPLKTLSSSLGELSNVINGEIPFNTNAWTNWLNTNSTTKDTSYQIYNANKLSSELEKSKLTSSYVSNTISSGLGLAGGVGAGLMATGGNPAGAIVGGSLGFLNAANRSIAGKYSLNWQKQQIDIQNKNEFTKLNSKFANIENSSGKNITLPSYTSGAFMSGGLKIVTSQINPNQLQQIVGKRLVFGYVVNEINNYRRYDNRQQFNILCFDSDYNYDYLVDIFHNSTYKNQWFIKLNDSCIDSFLNEYAKGIVLIKNKVMDVYNLINVTDNYENNIYFTDQQLDDYEDNEGHIE